MGTVAMVNHDEVAVVDDTDDALVAQFRWHSYAIGRNTYAMSQDADGRTLYMHRLIMGRDGPEVDHRNGDGLDNRRKNLRQTAHALNLANQRPQLGRSSQFKGVSWNRRSRSWEAYIKVNQKQRKLGHFKNEQAAARSYDAAAAEAWGEYARPNFPLASMFPEVNEVVDVLAREIERLEGRLEAAVALHRRSAFPAPTGEHRGRHYCGACTVSVDDFTAYVDWPCPTALALGVEP